MSDEQPSYYSYLLRLWRVNDTGGSIWHASLEDAHTGKRTGFADLESLFAFLEQQVGDTGKGEDKSPAEP